MRFQKIKKIAILLSILFTSLVTTQEVQAEDMITYLRIIAENTTTMVQQLNELPSYLKAWMSPDNSNATATLQGGFTQLGNLLNQDMSTQASLQTTLNSDLLNNDGSNILNSNIGQANVTGIANEISLPYANDLIYSTLLGSPYYAKDPRTKEGQKSNINSPYNYIKNASGLNLFHQIPAPGWRGSQGARLRYQNYFNTVTAVESFNAYTLSHQYADGNQFNSLQNTLITQATDPTKWFAQVASENIGFVLRQLLLYESQIFVLLTQLIQLEKQAVTAHVMTNALLISINQTTENVMVANAQGQQPTL